MLILFMLLGASAAQSPPARASETAAVVSAAVDAEFPSHDLDGDGKLSRAEFEKWLVALRAERRPSTRADRAWASRAFARADRDRSAGVTAAELTGFLTGAPS